MEFIFAGGAMEVGGSCIYVNTGNCRLLLDAGIRQGGSKDPLPDFRSIQTSGGIDAMIISHAHMDHIGSLPIISKAYPMAPIYMTKMTAELSRVLLYDSLKIMDRREDEIPVYSELDVKDMLGRVRILRYLTPMELLQDLTVTMYPAGHIAGASCVYITSSEGSLFYSGDISNFTQRTIEGARIPKLRPDIAILESTYGNRLHSNRQAEEQRLVALVSEYVRKKAHILIPAFALGRAQEVLLILRSAMQNGEIPEAPVYVDGMVRDINRVYTLNPTFLKNSLAKRILKGQEPFYTEQIQEVKPKDVREDLFSKNAPSIFVSSSGMLTGGPSLFYAKKILPMEDSCIIITGYQDEEAPGRMLLNLLEHQEEEQRVTLDGTTLPVNCHIEQVGLSAHGDQSELSGIIERISARKIILVHGDQDAIHTLGENLTSDFRRQIYQPVAGDRLEIEIRKKRKQLNLTLAYSMQKFSQDSTPLPEGNSIKEFWEYWSGHYENKALTQEQAAFIWSGKNQWEDGWLQSFQESLIESPYFSRDSKRLFLIRPNTEQEVLEQQKKSEITPQEIEAWMKAHVQGYEIRKMGFYPAEKKVILSFDFPDVIERNVIAGYSKELETALGWRIAVNPSMNHQKAAGLLQVLFEKPMQKISYFEAKKEYHITGDVIDTDSKKAAEDFYSKTGWALYVNGSTVAAGKPSANEPAKTDSRIQNGWFLPDSSAEAIEQNLAFSCMEQSFDGADMPEEHAPYKTGIKSDADGKYMELAFLSPQLGSQHGELLQSIANQIGWRLHIADSVNQNTLIAIAVELCKKYQISISKNPSYLPQSRTVRLKCPDITALPEEMCKEFQYRTGCGISCTE